MNPRRRLGLYLGVGAAATAIGAGVAWWRLAPSAADADAVTLLWAQTYPDHRGEPFDLQALRGQALVVNFWATWCPPCVEEMPELSELHDDLSPKGLQMLGIGIDSAPNIAKFAVARPVSYPLLVAGAGGSALMSRFGNTSGALPFTVLIERSGRISQRILGRVRIDTLTRQARALLA